MSYSVIYLTPFFTWFRHTVGLLCGCLNRPH